MPEMRRSSRQQLKPNATVKGTASARRLLQPRFRNASHAIRPTVRPLQPIQSRSRMAGLVPASCST